MDTEGAQITEVVQGGPELNREFIINFYLEVSVFLKVLQKFFIQN